MFSKSIWQGSEQDYLNIDSPLDSEDALTENLPKSVSSDREKPKYGALQDFECYNYSS